MSHLSIIIPVYNSEKFLERCIESVLAQTFSDFELLLIDDGSVDSSGQICDAYSLKDSRVHVAHKKNEGVSVARNFGLQKAIGEWVVFVDSDDFVDETYLENLLQGEIHQADLVIGNTLLEVPEGVETCITPVVRHSDLYINNFKALLSAQNLTSGSGPVAKLFNRRLITDNNLRFPEDVKLGEDTCFFFTYLSYCNVVMCVEEADYHIVWHLESLSQKKHDFTTEYKGYVSNRHAIMSFLETKNLVEILEDTYVHWVTYFLHRALTSLSTRKEMESISDNDWDFFFKYFRPFSRKTKLDFWVFKNFRKSFGVIKFYLSMVSNLRAFVAQKNMWKLMSILRK